jgi:glycosyltransferase involved in cell wall biosynthesis
MQGLAENPTLVVARNNLTLGAKVLDALNPLHWTRSLSRLKGRASGLPREIIRMDFPELSRTLAELLTRVHFDLVQLEYTAMAQYANVVRGSSPKTAAILEEIDISYLALERQLEVADDADRVDLQQQLSRMKSYERENWRNFDAVVTMSEEERIEVADVLDLSRVWVVPNGVDTAYFTLEERRNCESPHILFLGNLLHTPNHHGLKLLLSEIWPKLRKRNPLAKLDVVGEGASSELLCHTSESVAFHGFVSDIRPFLAASSLLVVPIWTGSGTRLKVLEAFASGLPVVSTQFGCQGVKAKADVHFLRAETPDEFVDRIVQLIKTPEIGLGIAAEARRLAENKFDWKVVTGKAEAVWEAVASVRR